MESTKVQTLDTLDIGTVSHWDIYSICVMMHLLGQLQRQAWMHDSWFAPSAFVVKGYMIYLPQIAPVHALVSDRGTRTCFDLQIIHAGKK